MFPLRKKDLTRVASIALASFNGNILFGRRRDSGKWTLPGGHLNPRESPLKGALRELREETGLKPISDSVEYLGSATIPKKNIIVYSFKAKYGNGKNPSGEDDPDKECSDFIWMDNIPEDLHNVDDVTLQLLGRQKKTLDLDTDESKLDKSEFILGKDIPGKDIDPWIQRKIDNGGEQEYEEWLRNEWHPGLDEEYPEHFGPPLKKSEDVDFDQLKGKTNLVAMFRAYKNSPHHPQTLLLKYMVNRIENPVYQMGTDQEISDHESKWLNLHKNSSGAEGSNRHIAAQDLHDAYDENIGLVRKLKTYQSNLHKSLRVHSPWAIKDINGKPHIALVRGLKTDVPGSEHQLSSWSDTEARSEEYGILHRRYIPLENIWHSFDLGPKKSSGNMGPEDEFLVSPDIKNNNMMHPIKAENKDINTIAPRNKFSFSAPKKDSYEDKLNQLNNPNFPPDILHKYIKDAAGLDMSQLSEEGNLLNNLGRAATRHKNVTDEDLDTVFSGVNYLLSKKTLFNPNINIKPRHIDMCLRDTYMKHEAAERITTKDQLNFVMGDGAFSDSFKDKIVSKKTHLMDDEQISSALRSPHIFLETIPKLIEHPKFNEGHLYEMIKDSPYISQNKARSFMKHPKFNSNHLSALMHKGSVGIRIEAAESELMTPDLISETMKDPVWQVAATAITNNNASEKNIDEALDHEDSRVHHAAIKSYNASPSNITKAIKSPSKDVRYEAVSHPKATKEHLDIGITDVDPKVRSAVISNPNHTANHIAVGLRDPDCDVRDQASHYASEVNSSSDPSLQKGLKSTLGAIALGGVLGVMHTPAKVPSQPPVVSHTEPVVRSVVSHVDPPPKPQDPVPVKWTPKGLHPELHAIAHLESSFGQNMNHFKSKQGSPDTAFGAVGLKPVTAHEEYKRRKDIKKIYPDLDNISNFEAKFKSDPEFYNTVASAHWRTLRSLTGSPSRAAYAWRYGLTAQKNADNEEVHGADYVKKFNVLLSNMGPKQIHKSDVPLNEIHEEFLGELDGFDVWKVHGDIVRNSVFVDFCEGGNSERYDFVPQTELWGEGDCDQDFWSNILHECTERKIMSGGVGYDKAHDRAAKIESDFRKTRKASLEAVRSFIEDHNDLLKAEACSTEVTEIQSWLKTQHLSKSVAIDPNEAATVPDMCGHNPRMLAAFAAARFLSGGKDLPESEIRTSVYEHDGDYETAALHAYGLPEDDTGRAALHSCIDISNMSKAEDEPIKVTEIKAAVLESGTIAEEVERSFKEGDVDRIKLTGKHSKGSLLARDPETKTTWLLKPNKGVGPAEGATEEKSTPSQREACFYRVAESWGIGNLFSETGLIIIDGSLWAAIKMLPYSYKNLGNKADNNPSLLHTIFDKYRHEGILHKLGLIDAVLGNADSHLNNLMVNDSNTSIIAIDHGTAFCGNSFSPGHDKNSFVPGYLRSTAKDFNSMTTEDKFKCLPQVSKEIREQLADWLQNIHADKLEGILIRYGINPQPSLTRLSKIKIMSSQMPVDVAVNRFWVEG